MGRVSGIRDRVEVAGSREPCFERRSNAGGRFGFLGGVGVRYKESRVWYMDGALCSGSAAESLRAFTEPGTASWDLCMRLQYLLPLDGAVTAIGWKASTHSSAFA